MPPGAELVRDGIPALCSAHGDRRLFMAVPADDITAWLLDKLPIEVAELVEAAELDDGAPDRTARVDDELADVMTILLAIARRHGRTINDLMRLVNAKEAARGGFEHGIVLLPRRPEGGSDG